MSGSWMLLGCTPPPSKGVRLYFVAKKQSFHVSTSLIFCESLLRQAAIPFGIALVTLDLSVLFTFSVLM